MTKLAELDKQINDSGEDSESEQSDLSASQSLSPSKEAKEKEEGS